MSCECGGEGMVVIERIQIRLITMGSFQRGGNNGIRGD
jgi:hypothetical protein